MRQFISTVLIVFLLLISSVAAEYTIDLSTTPEQITARDNPFAHYDDLGALPQLTVKVTDGTGMAAEDVTITTTVTHVDNLILPSGFPWVQGKELFSVTSYEEDGVLTVDGLLFPLRGEYTVDVTVLDSIGNQQKEQYTLSVAEPFSQSTLNGIIFVAVLTVFGFIVGLVFGKDLLNAKKAQGKGFGMFMLLVVLAVPFALAHSDAEIEETGIVHYEDEQVTFYTNPEVPDIGTKTLFTVEVKDENGMPVDNAVMHVELANEEEGFVVLETDIFSQTGLFTFQYGIFDGAPHVASITILPTSSSSTQFAVIEREYPFAGEAHSPPITAKLIATFVMLLAMLVGFGFGVVVRKMNTKGCADGTCAGDHDE